MEKPKYMPPKYQVSDFITARIALEQNERLARKMDAAKIIDEINRDDEAIRDYYYAPKVPSFKILKRRWDNQAFHFRDEEKK